MYRYGRGHVLSDPVYKLGWLMNVQNALGSLVTFGFGFYDEV